MSKTQWAGRQYSRYDLTITKIQKVISLVGTASMLAMAITLGASFILVLILIAGFSGVMVIAFILDKTGFQKATAEEIWEATMSRLWWNQINVLAILYNEYGNMTQEERQEKFMEFTRALGIDIK